MDSPLRIIRELVEVYNPDELMVDMSCFGFHMPFPMGEGFDPKHSINLHCDVEWVPAEQGVYLYVELKEIDLRPVKNPQDFLQELEQEIMTFLHSTVVIPEDGDSLPSNSFYFAETRQHHIKPVFSTVIEYETEDDAKALPDVFGNHMLYCGSALWLAYPVFEFIRREKREPTRPERTRELLIAHGLSQVLRPDTNFSRAEPPTCFFPEGFFGGKVSMLPPQ